MECFAPRYFQLFRCSAAACTDSCCKEWAVDVDSKTAAYYRTLEGSLGERLRQVLQDTDNGAVMTIENGRCPMWQEDGLCRIHAQLGHDALCDVCREFPRLRHDYGSFVELGLELSCPEAARLILTGDSSLVTTAISGGEMPEYDLEAMEILRATRAEILSFLQTRTYTPPQMLAILLLYAHEVQSQLDGGDAAVLAPEQMLRQAEGYAAAADLQSVFSFFLNLEILTPQWKNRLEQGPVPGSWTAEFPALAVYFIQRYWLQAVSDYDLIGRVKFAITACLLVQALGGDPVETAQQFSKEIENNPDNVDAILDGAYTSPALTDLQLLGLLLSQ